MKIHLSQFFNLQLFYSHFFSLNINCKAMSDLSLLLICLKCHEGVVRNPSSLVECLNGTNIQRRVTKLFPFRTHHKRRRPKGKNVRRFSREKRKGKKNPKYFSLEICWKEEKKSLHEWKIIRKARIFVCAKGGVRKFLLQFFSSSSNEI